MRHDRFTGRVHSVGRRLGVAAIVVIGAALMASTGGCEKVPTSQELIQEGQTTPAAGTPVAAAQPVPVQQPAAVLVPVAPRVEDQQKVIADFKNKPPYERNDQDLARLGNLTAGLDAFSNMDLNGSSVTDDGLKHLAKLTNLESLSLGGTKVTNAGLSVTLELPKLTSLNLAGCTVTLPMMETLSKVEKLDTLSLEGAKVGDNELVPLANVVLLKDLNLNNCPITDNGFKVLGLLKNLEILKVAQTSINGSGMQFLKRNKDEVGLRVLDAKKTRFGEQGLQYIRHIPTLEELDVGQAEVSDQTLALQLKGVSHLKKLMLSFNNISDNGTQVLGTIKSLEELYLVSCQRVGDKTLFFLKGNKELSVLDVNGCGGVTTQGAQSLKKFLPNCEIRSLGGKL